MNQNAVDSPDTRLERAAHNFTYPPTPDIAGSVRMVKPSKAIHLRPAYRFAIAIALAVLLLAGLMSVPRVRAAVLEFLRIGAVRIFMGQPSETPLPAATPHEESSPTSTPRFLASLQDLGGETTLERAKELSGLPILLPAYPADLGAPEHVFLQESGGFMVILVWDDPNHPGEPKMSLHIIGPGAITLMKFQPQLIETTKVNGDEAVWAVGPYPIELKNGELDIRRLVDGNVLIWSAVGITYRLESDLPMEEAIKVAESLR
jgi:hypothetical protein